MNPPGAWRLLLVGDAAEIGRIRLALGEAGREFEIEAADGADAIGVRVGERFAASRPDAVVIGTAVPNPLSAARRIRQISPSSQIVFLLPPARLERFRAGLPFVPHLGSAWTVSADALDDSLQATLHDAAAAGRERAGAAAILGRINRQITSPQSAETQVRRTRIALSERYLATLLSQSPDAFLAVDEEGALMAWNEAAARLFGIASDEALGTRATLLFPEEHRAAIERLIGEARREESVLRYELPLYSAGGRDLVEAEVSLAPVHDEAGRVAGISMTARDVTARKRAEDELRRLNQTLEERIAQALAEREKVEEVLRQAQKMEAVGRLTGGIAHDFNNMLAVVIGSLDLLGRRIDTAEPRARRYLDAAMEGARRAALLTQRLLAFSRQQPLRPQSVDANRLVVEMSDLVRGSLGADIRFETVLADGLWRTHADPNQLESAILNLAVNARDAMPEGGRLTIETRNAQVDARQAAATPGATAGPHVLIAVTDTGTGMPPEVIAKAFDPFFTTKEIGKGTGLGLSQVYGFVSQSGGHVGIRSAPGQGTTVEIYLPRLQAAPVPESIHGEATPRAPRGTGREVVLVVEDEASMRRVSVEALTELGYVVLEAGGAREALRLLDARPEIALLFTDVVMPDMNGRALADEARRRRPHLKVVFTTGHARDALVDDGVLGAGVEVVAKPFTLEELAARIGEALEEPLAEADG